MFYDLQKMNLKKLLRLVKEDAEGLNNYFELFTTRKFYIGDTGINRKTLKDWEGNDLLPFQYDNEGWRKFSFQEWVWLECIFELRLMGVSIEKIKEIKIELFDNTIDEFYQSLKDSLPTFKESYGTPDKMDFRDFEKEKPSGEFKEMVTKYQISPFLMVLISIIIENKNICIVYSNSKYFSFLVLGNYGQKIQQLNNEVLQELSNDSFMLLNLRKIVNRLFQKPNLKHNDNFVIDFLSEKEKQILDEIRTTNASEITIKFKEGLPTHIKVHRNQISKEILNKIARLLKTGSYKDISWKERNGKLIHYSEAILKKLK